MDVTPLRRRYERILTLQRQMLRIEVLRLAGVRAALRDLESREANLIQKLGDDNCVALKCTDALVAGLKSAARLRQELASEAEQRATAARIQSARVEQVERVAANARESSERKLAESRLREIIDWEIGCGKVSVP
jgi:hypothetical protein